MLHFRPRFCDVATCGCASPIAEAPLLVLGRPPQEPAGRREGPFFISSREKSVSIPRAPHEAAESCYVVSLTELVCLRGHQLLWVHPWLQGISRDFPSSTFFFFLMWPKYRVFKLRGLCLHVLIWVLRVPLEWLAWKYCNTGTWFPLRVKCEILSLDRMPQH